MAHLKVTIINQTDLAGIGDLNITLCDQEIPQDLVPTAKQIFTLMGATETSAGDELDKSVTISGNVPINFLAIHLSRKVDDTVTLKVQITDDAPSDETAGLGEVNQTGTGETARLTNDAFPSSTVEGYLERLTGFMGYVEIRVKALESVATKIEPFIDLIPGLGGRVEAVETVLNDLDAALSAHVVKAVGEAHPAAISVAPTTEGTSAVPVEPVEPPVEASAPQEEASPVSESTEEPQS